MKKKLTLTAICLYGIGNVFAQDTLKLGINNEIINVTPPEINHKVDVLIEDSSYNYHIMILKTDKTVTLMNGKNPTIAKPISKNKVTSSYLNEIEFGMSFIPSFNSVEVYHYSISNRNHITESFQSNGDGMGVYGSLILKNKRRIFTPSEKLYFRNVTQLKFNQNNYNGKMEYREIFATTPTRPIDSVGQVDVFKADVSLANLFLVKRFAFGILLNPKHQFSLEYGVDIGLRLSTKYISNVFNTNSNFNDRLYNSHVSSNTFISNPTFIFYQRLGVNYGRFSLNAASSIPKVKMGTYSYKEGHMFNIGLAYRFR